MTPQIIFLVYLVITSIISFLDKVLNLHYRKHLLLLSKDILKVKKKNNLREHQNGYVHVLILMTTGLIQSNLF